MVEILQGFQAYVTSDPKPTTYVSHIRFRHVPFNASLRLRDPELVLPTIVSGLQVYFDRSLGANLLYRFERPQYAGIRKQYVTGPKVIIGQEKEMSAVYGAEHLLRMLGGCSESPRVVLTALAVSMPQIVANSTMDAESVALVRDYVNELLQCVRGYAAGMADTGTDT